MTKSLSHLQSRIWRGSFHSKVLWRYEHRKVVYQNVEKTIKTSLAKLLSKIWSRFHFTRAIALNDEYLSQFFADRKVLWMTFEQLFEIFIKFDVFDCTRVIFVCLFVGFVNFRSVLGEETQKILGEPFRAWIESIEGAGLNIPKS